RVQAANQYAAANGLVGLTAVSPQFSLAVPAIPPWPGCISVSGDAGQVERDWYARQHIPLFTWSSVAAGFFSGRFTPDNLDSFDFWLDKVCVNSYCTPDNFARLERATQLAAERNLTPMQIAVAYVLNTSSHIFAIIGSRTPDEFAMNLTAVTCTLSPDEIRWLESGKN
ncbi:MAG TPA: aldo/keto reductase, partial [Chloroflexota bacterium]|nr:aldo/keto reductase [Chloroflexota bacterium]